MCVHIYARNLILAMKGEESKKSSIHDLYHQITLSMDPGRQLCVFLCVQACVCVLERGHPLYLGHKI